jgi:hypothetical protein
VRRAGNAARALTAASPPCESILLCSATENEPVVFASPPCHQARRRKPKPRFAGALDGVASNSRLSPRTAHDCDFLGILPPLGNLLLTNTAAVRAHHDSLSSLLYRSQALCVGRG